MNGSATAIAEALTRPTESSPDPAAQLRAVRDGLSAQFAERSIEAHLLALCLVAQTHLTLVGEPGNAKSLIVKDFARAITGANYFETQVAADSPAQRVLGPYSIPALDEGRFEFNVEGMLPEAHIALLDEGYRANATFLDNLLAILNERIFHNGRDVLAVPLWMAVIACNQLPDPGDERTEAFRDRIAVTRIVTPVRSDTSRLAVLHGQLTRRRSLSSGAPVPTIDRATIVSLQSDVAAVATPDGFLSDALKLWRDAEREGLPVSARRFGEIIKLAQAQALIDGRTSCRRSDLVVAEHVLWIDPDDAPLAAQLAADYEDRTSHITRELLAGCLDLEQRISGVVQDFADQDPFADLPGNMVTEGVNIVRSAKELERRINELLVGDPDDQTLLGALGRVTAAGRTIEDALMGGGA